MNRSAFAIVLFISVVFVKVILSAAIEPVEREVYAMGTYLRMSLYESSRTKAIKQLENLLTVFEESEQQLSTWRLESEISRLNSTADGARFHASGSLFDLMLRAQHLCRSTDGYFDPTVGALTGVWRIHSGFALPTRSAIKKALQNSGCDKLTFLADSTIVKYGAIKLDVGGFGKGYALERAVALAKRNEYAPLLLNFGGQIAVHGKPSEDSGWRIQIANPMQRRESAVTVQINSGSLSTSSGSERSGHVKGKKIGHILNPHTGYPIQSFGSVTVWTESALEADAFSTALYAMGPVRGFTWAKQHNVAACFLIAVDGKIEQKMTPEFAAILMNK